MKCALLVDHDAAARDATATILQSLGYVVAPTDCVRTALHTVQAIRVDAVLTDTAFNEDDRRGFVGELARLAPSAPVILMTDKAGAPPLFRDGCVAIVPKPVSPRDLRRILEFGIDGCGMQPSHPGCNHERRRQPDRRHRKR